MPKIEYILIFILFIIGVCALFFLIAPPRRHKKKRRTDRVKLKGHQKRIYSQVKNLIARGNIKGAAQLLESLGMIREAIDILEKSNHIREAANILLRIQRPNRAAMLYTRHGMWQQAADSFEMANMPIEVAKCARELGDLKRAIRNFKVVKRYEDAAECYARLGSYHEAAKLYYQAGNENLSLELYNEMLQKTSNYEKLDLTNDEIDFLKKILLRDNTNSKVADLLATKNRLLDVIIQFIHEDKLDPATELFIKCNENIAPLLLSEESFDETDFLTLAKLFQNVANHEYAGMVYERCGFYDRAGEEFEIAEDFNRAIYCYERAGLKEKSEELRERVIAESSSSTPSPSEEGQNPFILSEPTCQADNLTFNKDSITQILDNKEGWVPPPPTNNNNENNGATQIIAPAPEFPDNSSIDTTGDDRGQGGKFQLEAALTVDKNRPIFHKMNFLHDLSFQQKDLILKIAQKINYNEGSCIIDHNSHAKGIYFLISGSVNYYKIIAGQEKMVDEMPAPSTFGEFWLMIDTPSNVKIVAKDSCLIYLVDRELFNELLDKNGAIARKLYKRFMQKLVERFLVPQQNK